MCFKLTIGKFTLSASSSTNSMLEPGLNGDIARRPLQCARISSYRPRRICLQTALGLHLWALSEHSLGMHRMPCHAHWGTVVCCSWSLENSIHVFFNTRLYWKFDTMRSICRARRKPLRNIPHFSSLPNTLVGLVSPKRDPKVSCNSKSLVSFISTLTKP